jgi:hypothetical protein
MEESAIAKRKRDELMAVVEKKTVKRQHDMRGDVRIRAERSPHSPRPSRLIASISRPFLQASHSVPFENRKLLSVVAYPPCSIQAS